MRYRSDLDWGYEVGPSEKNVQNEPLVMKILTAVKIEHLEPKALIIYGLLCSREVHRGYDCAS
jgi:hypothetical protein